MPAAESPPAPAVVAPEVEAAEAVPAASPKADRVSAPMRALNPVHVASADAAVSADAVAPPSARAVATETVVAPSAAAPPPAPYETASITPAPYDAPDPRLPRAVATLSVTPQTFKQDTSGYHGCPSGERIITSFYWEGKHTASGEKFDPDRRFAAAHRTLPFGTRLMITNPRTGKSVYVTVNDRGPYAKGVTLDLTRSAALAIGMQGTGAVCMSKL